MRQTRWQISLFVAVLVAGVAFGVTGQAQSPADRWWTGYGNGADNSRYFAARQINKSNVNRLQVAWTYPYGDTGSNPIVVRGVVYGRGRNGSLVAVDATDRPGAVGPRKHDRHDQPRHELLGERRRPRPAPDLCDEQPAPAARREDGQVDDVVRHQRRRRSARSASTAATRQTIGNIQSNRPGEVFENLHHPRQRDRRRATCRRPATSAPTTSLTGKLVWTFHTVPRPGEFGYDTWPKDAWKYIGGVNNWGEMTVDARRGIAYIPLGSPTYDFYGADRPGANLFGTSIVALDARTGKRLWHFQLVHHDLWDLDPNAAPQLTTIRHNGRSRDVVVGAGQDRRGSTCSIA